MQGVFSKTCTDTDTVTVSTAAVTATTLYSVKRDILTVDHSQADISAHTPSSGNGDGDSDWGVYLASQ